VELNTQYALVLYTNAGLWGYEIGDTVKFTSLSPPRIKVTGRTKHFTSAFGEHVIAEEVEGALKDALALVPGEVAEFTVAPQTAPKDGLPYHEWFIEFAAPPADMARFAVAMDEALQKRNPYYKDPDRGQGAAAAGDRGGGPGRFRSMDEGAGHERRPEQDAAPCERPALRGGLGVTVRSATRAVHRTALRTIAIVLQLGRHIPTPCDPGPPSSCSWS
jgi:hypothetical protein